MDYLKHYKKNFDELLKLSDDEDFRKKNFEFFSKNGFPVKKKSDERWKYIDLRSLEKTLYISDLKNSVKGPNLNDIGIQAQHHRLIGIEKKLPHKGTIWSACFVFIFETTHMHIVV